MLTSTHEIMTRLKRLEDLETKLFHIYKTAVETYGGDAPEAESTFQQYFELSQALKYIRGQSSYYDFLSTSADMSYQSYVKRDISELQQQSTPKPAKKPTGFRWSLF